MTIGERIKARRAKLRLTQQQCADEMGVGQSRWADIEAGRTNPTVKLLGRVAKVLRCQVRDLL